MKLVEISENDFAEFKRMHFLTGVSDLSKSFGISIESAQKITEEQFQQTLPDGLRTKNHSFYFIEDSGKVIGHLWFCLRDVFGIQKIFVCDIRIEEGARGRGAGKMAMAWLEEKAKELGLQEIALHVFGTNQSARAWYEKLGFSPTSVQMSKKL